MEFKQTFTTSDGTTFDTKAEALEYMRKPKILAAMTTVAGGDAKLANWLVESKEAIEIAFEVGTIRRVSKAEHNKLAKALDAIIEANNPKFAFVADNKGAILDSFRWPSVKRMDEAEKAAAARNSLVAASEGNEELADWIVANKDQIFAAFEAGVQKREVSPKASQALAEYRAKQAAKKAAESQG